MDTAALTRTRFISSRKFRFNRSLGPLSHAGTITNSWEQGSQGDLGQEGRDPRTVFDSVLEFSTKNRCDIRVRLVRVKVRKIVGA